MKIINRADRLVGDCPVVDPLTFLAGCQQQDHEDTQNKSFFLFPFHICPPMMPHRSEESAL